MARSVLGGVLLASASVSTGAARPAPEISLAHCSVTQSRGGSTRVELCALESSFPYGAAVMVTISLHSVASYSQPFRWGCGRFATLVETTPRGIVQQPAPLVGAQPCDHPGAIGVLRPYHTWKAVQVVRLLHRGIAAQFVTRRHNVDTPGSIDVPFISKPLVFAMPQSQHGGATFAFGWRSGSAVPSSKKTMPARRIVSPSGGDAARSYAQVLAHLQTARTVDAQETDRGLPLRRLARYDDGRIRLQYAAPDTIERTWQQLNPVGKPVTLTSFQSGTTICLRDSTRAGGRWLPYRWPLLFHTHNRVDLPRTLREAVIALPRLHSAPGMDETLTLMRVRWALGGGRSAPGIRIVATIPRQGGGAAPVVYHGKTYQTTGSREDGVIVIDPATRLPSAYHATTYALIVPGAAMARGPAIVERRIDVAFRYGTAAPAFSHRITC